MNAKSRLFLVLLLIFPLPVLWAHAPFIVCLNALSEIRNGLQEIESKFPLEKVYPVELLRLPYDQMPRYNRETSLWHIADLPDGQSLPADETLNGVSREYLDQSRKDVVAEHGDIWLVGGDKEQNSFLVTASGRPMLVLSKKSSETSVRHEMQHFHDWQILRDYIVKVNGKDGDSEFLEEAGRRAFVAIRGAENGMGKLHIESRATLVEYDHMLQQLKDHETSDSAELQQSALAAMQVSIPGNTAVEKTMVMLEGIVSKAGYAHATAIWNMSEEEAVLAYDIKDIPKYLEELRGHKVLGGKLREQNRKIDEQIAQQEAKLKASTEKLAQLNQIRDEYFADYLRDYKRNAKLVLNLLRQHIPAAELPQYQILIDKLQATPGPKNSMTFFPETDPLMAGWYPGIYYSYKAFEAYLIAHPY